MGRRRGVTHEPGGAAPAADLDVKVPNAASEAVNEDPKASEPNLKGVEGEVDTSKESREVRELPRKGALKTELHARLSERGAKRVIDSLTNPKAKDDRPAVERANEVLRSFWPVYKQAGVVREGMSTEEMDALRDSLVVADGDPKVIQREAAKRLRSAMRRIRGEAGIGNEDRAFLKDLRLEEKIDATGRIDSLQGYLGRTARRWEKKMPSAGRVNKDLKNALHDSFRLAVTAGADSKEARRLLKGVTEESKKIKGAAELNAFLREKIASTLGYVDENLFVGVPEQKQLVDELLAEAARWSEEDGTMSQAEVEAWAEAEFSATNGAPAGGGRRGPQRRRLEARRAKRAQEKAEAGRLSEDERARVLDHLFDIHNELRSTGRFVASAEGAQMSPVDVAVSLNRILNKGLGVARNAGVSKESVKALRGNLFVDPKTDPTTMLKTAEDSMQSIRKRVAGAAGIRADDMQAFRERQAAKQPDADVAAATADTKDEVELDPDSAEVGEHGFAEYGALDEDMVGNEHPYAVEMGEGGLSMYEAQMAALDVSSENPEDDMWLNKEGEVRMSYGQSKDELTPLEEIEEEITSREQLEDAFDKMFRRGADYQRPPNVRRGDAESKLVHKEVPKPSTPTVDVDSGDPSDEVTVTTKADLPVVDPDAGSASPDAKASPDAGPAPEPKPDDGKSALDIARAARARAKIEETDRAKRQAMYLDVLKDVRDARAAEDSPEVPTDAGSMFYEAMLHVMNKGDVSNMDLQTTLGVGIKEVEDVIALLEKYGVVGFADTDGKRDVLMKSYDEFNEQHQLDPEVVKMQALGVVRKEAKVEAARLEALEAAKPDTAIIDWDDVESDPVDPTVLAKAGAVVGAAAAMGATGAKKAAKAAGRGIDKGIVGTAGIATGAAKIGLKHAAPFGLVALTKVPGAVGTWVGNLPGRALDVVDDFLGYLQGITNSFGFTFGKFRADKTPKDRGKLIMNAEEKNKFDAANGKGGKKGEGKKKGKKKAA